MITRYETFYIHTSMKRHDDLHILPILVDSLCMVRFLILFFVQLNYALIIGTRLIIVIFLAKSKCYEYIFDWQVNYSHFSIASRCYENIFNWQKVVKAFMKIYLIGIGRSAYANYISCLVLWLVSIVTILIFIKNLDW